MQAHTHRHTQTGTRTQARAHTGTCTQTHTHRHADTGTGTQTHAWAHTALARQEQLWVSHPQDLHSQQETRGQRKLMKGEREAGKRLWKVFPAKLVRPAFQPQQREEWEALMARSGLWDKNKLHAEALCHPPSPAHTLWAAGLTPNPDSSSHFSSGPPHRPPDLKSRGQNSPISRGGGLTLPPAMVLSLGAQLAPRLP